MKARKSVEGEMPKDAAPGESREGWPEEAGGSREPDAHREKPDPPDGTEEKRPQGKVSHRKSRRKQRPARGELAYGKPKDTETGESRRSRPKGRTEEAMPGASRESRPTKSLRRDSRPCEIVNEKTPETRVSGVFVLNCSIYL
jgi:hypothetical protein